MIAIPVSPDQLMKAGSVEVVEVPTTGAVVVQELVKYCDKAIERSHIKLMEEWQRTRARKTPDL